MNLRYFHVWDQWRPIPGLEKESQEIREIGEREPCESAGELRHFHWRDKDKRREHGHPSSSQRPSWGNTSSPKPLIPTLKLEKGKLRGD